MGKLYMHTILCQRDYYNYYSPILRLWSLCIRFLPNCLSYKPSHASSLTFQFSCFELFLKSNVLFIKYSSVALHQLNANPLEMLLLLYIPLHSLYFLSLIPYDLIYKHFDKWLEMNEIIFTLIDILKKKIPLTCIM